MENESAPVAHCTNIKKGYVSLGALLKKSNIQKLLKEYTSKIPLLKLLFLYEVS